MFSASLHIRPLLVHIHGCNTPVSGLRDRLTQDFTPLIMLCAEEESSSEEMVGQEPEEAAGGSSGAEGASPTSGHYTGPSAGCTAVSTTSMPDPGGLP